MSILLDAVTKQKQQSSHIQDAVLTPIPSHSKPQKNHLAGKIALLFSVVILAIAAAWALDSYVESRYLQHETAMPPEAQPVTLAATSAEVSKVDTKPVSNTHSTTDQTQEFTLAGKVALPRATSLPDEPILKRAAPQTTETSSTNSANRNKIVNSGPAVSANQQNAANSALSLAQLQMLSDEYDQQNGFVSQPSQSKASQPEVSEANAEVQEPIILGANANKRGLQELEALKLQVNMAANEVDFKSVQQQPDNSNNLADAFAAALKEVEYEQSANKDVSAPELDPIPKAKPQGIPKYGDLPASVQLSVPEFNIVAHVYSSEPSQRWLNVDGEELQQGDMIQNKLTIVEIRPRDVVLEIDGQEFKVPAI
ncbi:general secretion pathway protein GspB [Shewanella gaetbuli]|uniref:General secretion pathway protein GspB n=1 Tax=Shewanella gaetbuli TaxID=220752 RepID=A0A9X1ZI47_9GAMM|nr:general secretion pathway protein GspB [Shewanella gaetbuli]MCL1141941.1 general secretion pathway protein GspB [Shewanella gaetbuli]